MYTDETLPLEQAQQTCSATSQELLISTISGWSDTFVSDLITHNRTLRDGKTSGLDSLILDELQTNGLLKKTGQLTPFGRQITQCLLFEDWQTSDEFGSLVTARTNNNQGAVLDVGCSTGYILREKLKKHGVYKAGVDSSGIAIALAKRLAELNDSPIDFSVESGEQLSFNDNSFDTVICRNAITYMNQNKSLKEFCRVLKSGGDLVIRYENVLYDLNTIARKKSLISKTLRIKDLFWGGVKEISIRGVQPNKNKLAPGRTFGSLNYYKKQLAKYNCQIVEIHESQHCPKFLGRPTQVTFIAKKVGST